MAEESAKAKDVYAPRLASPAAAVVVTGGASGIGFAVAEAVAAVGRSVALWDINADGVKQAARAIEERFGVQALGQVVDIRALDAMRKGAAETRAALGPVGGIAHCAGNTEITGIEGVTPENWDRGLALHARAIVHLAQVFLDDMRKVKGAAMVAMSSINASLGSGAIPIYCASKGAVVSLVHSMADALAKDGIRINCISPGNILTPLSIPHRDRMPGYFERHIMLARWGEPEEIGRVARFLLSDEASYVTSAEVLVDGGNVHSQRY